MAITLTQDSYRLWARIGYIRGITDMDADVIAQLAQLAADSIIHETP
jgi:hypothetical protein